MTKHEETKRSLFTASGIDGKCNFEMSLILYNENTVLCLAPVWKCA